MIDSDTFMKSSPFTVSHKAEYNLANTTPDLLKFQLQEEYRTKLRELKDNRVELPNLTLLNSQFLEGSFNNHLQSAIQDTTLSEVPSLSLTPTLEDLEQPGPANYLNLRILIENSVFDTSKINKDSILSLAKLKTLKQVIFDKRELQQYLLSRITLSQQFTTNVVLRPHDLDVDAQLLVKVLKLNNLLQQQLLTINEELEYLTQRLNNHNLACLALGYVEDVKLTSSHARDASAAATPKKLFFPDQPAAELALDEVFAHVAHVAAQRSVTLPEPETANRVEWTKRCIDAILAAPAAPVDVSASATPEKERSFDADALFLLVLPFKTNGTVNDKMLAEYKTALKDLRFSHHYLMKDYEHLKKSSLKLLLEYRKKNAQLEKEVARLRSGSSTPVLAGTLTPKEEPNDILVKEREIAKLRKELNLLKIDKLGMRNGSSLHLAHSPQLGLLHSPVGDSLLLSLVEDDVPDALLVNSASTRPTSFGGPSSMSTSILRKEFKKIVSEIQDHYELELSEERLKRRNLEEQLR